MNALKMSIFKSTYKSYGLDFPGDPVDKNPPAKSGDKGSVHGPGRFHMLLSD